MYVDELDPSDCHGVLDVFAEQYCSVKMYERFLTVYADELDPSGCHAVLHAFEE